MQIKIRKATLADRDTIASFQVDMAWETEHYKLNFDTVKLGVGNALNDKNLGEYYVAEVNHTVIGSLFTTYEWSDWRNGTVVWIQSVFVSPDFRKRGVYALLYGHVKNIVGNDASLCGIRLYVDKTNEAAQQVYSRLGMDGDHYRVFEWMKQ